MPQGSRAERALFEFGFCLCAVPLRLVGLKPFVPACWFVCEQAASDVGQISKAQQESSHSIYPLKTQEGLRECSVRPLAVDRTQDWQDELS